MLWGDLGLLKNQQELYDAWSDGGLQTDSQDSQDHGIWPEDL